MVNSVHLIGRVANDVEIGDLSQKVAKFRLATNEKYKNKAGEIVENTDFHSIVCWNNVAEICEKYVKKGDLLYCEGKIKNRSWEDKEGGKHYITEIVVDTIRLLSQKQQTTTTQQQPVSQPQPVVSGGKGQSNNTYSSYSAQDTDLPF